jgi:ribosomal protein L16 Arg81 hydroxylase
VQAALAHPYIRAALQAHPAAGGTAQTGAGSDEAKLLKSNWVLEMYRRSARQGTTFGQVPRVPKLSRQAFLDEHYAANRPVVMTGAMDDWPAMTRWTDEELKRRFGDRVVEVQANRNTDANYEINQTKLRTEMPLAEFVDLTATVGETNNYYITANNSGKNKAALRELWDDVVVFPEYLRNDDPSNRGFFWFGPKGTVTPLHHDLTNNFMAQVRGRKLVRLIAPYHLPNLYNYRHCYSSVDLDAVDYDRFPLFRNVTVIDVVIGPGDLLFLPIGWWHYVRGLDVSITMTFTNFVFDNDFSSFYTTYNDI